MNKNRRLSGEDWQKMAEEAESVLVKKLAKEVFATEARLGMKRGELAQKVIRELRAGKKD